MDLNKQHIRDTTISIVPYLTVHSPMLATCMRTTMGRRVKDNPSDSLLSRGDIDIGSTVDSQSPSSSSSLCYKFNTKQFVVRCTNNSMLGNGCLWVVIRDDNLLGDVDVIGASNIPLIDTAKLAKSIYNDIDTDNEYNDVYVHFKRDVTFATCQRGYIEGHLKCQQMTVTH